MVGFESSGHSLDHLNCTLQMISSSQHVDQAYMSNAPLQAGAMDHASSFGNKKVTYSTRPLWLQVNNNSIVTSLGFAFSNSISWRARASCMQQLIPNAPVLAFHDNMFLSDIYHRTPFSRCSHLHTRHTCLPVQFQWLSQFAKSFLKATRYDEPMYVHSFIGSFQSGDSLG